MPGYINDAQTLADVVSPAAAASQAGVQNEQNNEAEAVKNRISQLTMPAQVDEPYLKNLFTQAQTGQTNALAQKYGLENQLAAGTLQGDIASKNAASGLKITQDQEQKMVTVGQIAANAAAYMDNVPPPARQAAMIQLMQANGIKDPSQLGPLIQGDPDMLRNFSQKMFDLSSQAKQARLEGGIKSSSAANVASIEAAGHVQGARETAGAREYAADVAARVKQATAGMGALQQQLYAKVANGTATPEERMALDSMNQVQQLTRTGSPFQASITGTQVPSNVPPVPSAPSNNVPQVSNAPQAAMGSPADVEAEMRKRGFIK